MRGAGADAVPATEIVKNAGMPAATLAAWFPFSCKLIVAAGVEADCVVTAAGGGPGADATRGARVVHHVVTPAARITRTPNARPKRRIRTTLTPDPGRGPGSRNCRRRARGRTRRGSCAR